MSSVPRPTPSIEEEKQFHERNHQISITQRKLTKGARLKYSTVKRFVDDVEYMRRKNRLFNTTFGLFKEIA